MAAVVEWEASVDHMEAVALSVSLDLEVDPMATVSDLEAGRMAAVVDSGLEADRNLEHRMVRAKDQASVDPDLTPAKADLAVPTGVLEVPVCLALAASTTTTDYQDPDHTVEDYKVDKVETKEVYLAVAPTVLETTAHLEADRTEVHKEAVPLAVHILVAILAFLAVDHTSV